MVELLKARFSEHRERHPNLEWSEVEQRLREVPAAITILQKMEETGGEPDTIGYDAETGKLIFCDCAKESPAGRRVRQRRTKSERDRRFDDDGGTLSQTAESWFI